MFRSFWQFDKTRTNLENNYSLIIKISSAFLAADTFFIIVLQREVLKCTQHSSYYEEIIVKKNKIEWKRQWKKKSWSFEYLNEKIKEHAWSIRRCLLTGDDSFTLRDIDIKWASK